MKARATVAGRHLASEPPRKQPHRRGARKAENRPAAPQHVDPEIRGTIGESHEAVDNRSQRQAHQREVGHQDENPGEEIDVATDLRIHPVTRPPLRMHEGRDDGEQIHGPRPNPARNPQVCPVLEDSRKMHAHA